MSGSTRHRRDEEFPRVRGQGPNAHVTHHRRLADGLLPDWSDWEQHDGRGVPAKLIGQTIMIAGCAHDGSSALPDRVVEVTPAYVVSARALVWTWALGYGGVSGWRLRRAQRLPVPDDVLAAIDRDRPAGHPLVLGLDGTGDERW
jgi:hypothetical protein